MRDIGTSMRLKWVKEGTWDANHTKISRIAHSCTANRIIELHEKCALHNELDIWQIGFKIIQATNFIF